MKMNKSPFIMGQTKQDDFATAASTMPQPLNFAAQDFSYEPSSNTSSPVKSGSSRNKSESPSKDHSGRPSTPFPENEVQFLPSFSNVPGDEPMGGYAISVGGSNGQSFSNPLSMSSSPPVTPLDLPYSHGHPSMPHSQEQWASRENKPYVTHSLDLDSSSTSSAVHKPNPFEHFHHSASCDSGHLTSTSPPEKDDRISSSSVRRSRVWKYGRRSSGNHSDRQPFTFSVSASQAGAMSAMDPRGSRFFGKRTFSNSATDEAWSSEPSHKQFISEERMTAEMHNLSLDGFSRAPLFSQPSSSSSSSSSSPPSPPSHTHTAGLPSTSGSCSHGNPSSSSSSSNLLRHHQCHHPRRASAQAVLADIERRLNDDSDDEGVEEDMPPSQGEGHRLEMAPQLVSALKAKGASTHMLPHDIVKKIVASPCLDLVLWKPPMYGPRPPPDSPNPACPSSPPSSSMGVGSELAPIMEVEVERERGEAAPSPNPRRLGYGNPDLGGGGEGMQDEAEQDFDEDMDL